MLFVSSSARVHLLVEPLSLFGLEVDRFFMCPQNFIYQNQPVVEPEVLPQAIVSSLDLFKRFLVALQVRMVPLCQLEVPQAGLLRGRPVCQPYFQGRNPY